MPKLQPAGDLEIEENIGFHRRYWLVQRITWVFLFLIVAAALGGLFGSGPLSHASESSERITAEYDRITRAWHGTEIKLRVRPRDSAPGFVRVHFNRDFLDVVNVQQVNPPPHHVEAGADGNVFVFQLFNASAEITLVFELETKKPGIHHAAISVDDTAPLELKQVALP